MSKRKRPVNRPPRTIATKDPRPVLLGPPNEASRRPVRWLIIAFLVINLVLPLRWYLGRSVGAEVDERFAWRMFSADSLQRVEIEFWETVAVDGRSERRRVPLETIMQPGWAKVLQAYHQPALVAKFLERHCSFTAAQSVEFRRTGVWSDGSPVAPVVVKLECEGK